MIDNSIGMGDKQALLKPALATLLGKLIAPTCVDASGTPSGGTVDAQGACPAPNRPEFQPIADIHVGIVSSSLGAHGGSVCAAPAPSDDPAN